MQIKAEEISSIIKEKIKGFDKQIDVKETGSVIQVGDGIARSMVSRRHGRRMSNSPAALRDRAES